ncbi:Acetyl-coenzyme A transporter 1 [Turdus rufiventris]|nr:Acetyl-coenzyme A transporter 1 [Turdus rufiventris]
MEQGVNEGILVKGIPLGLAGSVPLILQSKNASYTDQAFFSFVFWPFSLKLLWAPLVDAVYLRGFGRRKSWLVPTQYVLGLFMIYMSTQVDALLGDGHGRGPDVLALTVTFFLFEFLAATQDIAVDGWALTMLSRENVGYASTCNSVGQTAGYFLGNVLFLALESASFCNKYLRFEPQPRGIVTLSDFLFFWGAVFLITTTLVAFLKKENQELIPAKEETKGITDTYKLLFSIIKMPAVLTFCILILTSKVGFSAADAVTGLKLVEEGVPKEHLALLAVPMVPLQIILPLVISKYTAGPQPLNTFYKAMPYRLLLGLEFAFLVWWAPKVKHEGGFPVYYYAVVVLSYALHQITLYSMYVAIMAFNAKVSDPLIGGTYMTLLNTVSNLGGNWPSTVALWLVDPLTVKECAGAQGHTCATAATAETTKFINPLDIPVEFVEKNVKLRGKLQHITEKGLEIEHIPISIPFFTAIQRKWQPEGFLLIRLAGVELAPGATAWLQRELLPKQPLWFQLLGRDSSALNCLVLVHKGAFLSTCLNEELLRQGLARAARIEGLPHHSRLYWKLHKRLLRAELKAVKKKKGIWKEQSYSETLQERISSNKFLQRLKQFVRSSAER